MEAERATGGTEIYYAAMEGLRQLENYDLSQYTPAIILLTDGVSDGSFSDFGTATRLRGGCAGVLHHVRLRRSHPAGGAGGTDPRPGLRRREDLIGAFRSVKGTTEMKKGQLRQLVLSLGVGIAVFLVLALGLRWNFLFSAALGWGIYLGLWFLLTPKADPITLYFAQRPDGGEMQALMEEAGRI